MTHLYFWLWLDNEIIIAVNDIIIAVMKFIDSENKTSAKTLKKSSLSKLQTSKHHIVPRVQSKDSFEISRFQQKERH